MAAQAPTTLPAKPVPPECISFKAQTPVSQPAATTLLITTRMALSVSPAMRSALPVEQPRPTTAPLALREPSKSSTLLSETQNTALPRVEPITGPSMTESTAEVEAISLVVCASHCSACTSGAASDCTLCEAGYFAQPSSNACEPACPLGSYANPVSRVCEPCSDLHCLDCSASKDTCTQCDTQSRYFLSGSSCSFCASPGVVSATECVSCPFPGYEVTAEGLCEEECGDGLLLGSTHECDDGNL